MKYFKDDVVEVMRGTGQGKRYRVAGYEPDRLLPNKWMVFMVGGGFAHQDALFLYHRPLKNHLKAVMWALVPPSWGRTRNALRRMLCCLLLGVVVARAGAESHLAPRRCAPCAHSHAAHVVWETNSHNTMAKTDEPVTNVKQWLKLFEGSALYKHEPSRLFEDYLELVLCCLANQRQEERYLQVAKRYSREELNTISQLWAYHLLIHEHQVRVRARTDGSRGWYDMLGDIYMELASRSKASRMGQFFTPVELCDCIAMMQFGDPAEADGKSCLDPCLGSGRMVLAMHALQPKLGLVAGADLDPICAKMSALNFWLHGIRGEVAHMNTLSLEWYFAWQTHPRASWPFVTFLDDARREESVLYAERAQLVQKPAPPDLFNTVQEPEEEYHRLKLEHPGVVLMFRLPGSYLFLHEDVATANQVLGLSMSGSEVLRIPDSWFDDVMPALCRAGHRVAVCDETLEA